MSLTQPERNVIAPPQLEQAQRLQQLGLLSGGMAHDFNNLLMMIGGHAECALADIQDQAAVADALAQIQQVVTRAMALTAQLLRSQAETPQPTAPLDLNSEARASAQLLRGRIAPPIAFDLLLAARPIPILADQAQIYQILQNLLVNAAEAIGPEGGRITISTDIVTLSGAPDLADGSYAVCIVTDTGCGIEPATLARVFDPFFTTKPHGHGLGLASVRAIIAQLRGAVRIQSVPARGTTLTVLLPQAG